MSRLEVPRECAQGLEDHLSIDKEEEKLLASEFGVVVGGTSLPSEVDMNKPQMEDYPNELEDLEILEDPSTTCCLEEAALY